ncbi:MAG: DUF4920 domain-containing protein [Bacteroidia bacterium]
MKRFLIFSSLLAFFIACTSDPRKALPETGSYGKTIGNEPVLQVSQVLAAMDTLSEMPVTVEGTVAEYCKGEGCWLTLKNDQGDNLLIEIKDKAFVLPYHIENKSATVTGIAMRNLEDSTLSVLAEGVVLK